MTADFHKAGLLIVRDGRILLCRKRNLTGNLILPGGCFEPAESPEQCLNREAREELGDVRLTDVKPVGTYYDHAAGDAGKTVQVDLYSATLHGRPSPCSEIAEIVWFGSADDRTQLAPSIRRKILPDLIARRILLWPEVE